MNVGYARECITPPIGTRMAGFTIRDRERGADGIHDDLFIRTFYADHDGSAVLIAGFDLLFFSRENADRLKVALKDALGLAPHQILLNTSHTHSGPSVSTWDAERDMTDDGTYMNTVEQALVRAATAARDGAVPASVTVGATTTTVPVNRRRPTADGKVEWLPYPDGATCDHLPFALFRADDRAPICLMFSISTHPSISHAWEISADYPGPMCDRMDAFMGTTCSLFLQGAAGDSKPVTIADGVDESGNSVWRNGGWDDIAAAGRLAADELVAGLETGSAAADPVIRSALVEVVWPLAPPPKDEPDAPTELPLLAHGIQLADNFRIIAVEGELVAELGNQVIARFDDGVTMALGYSNGTGVYLVTSKMLTEGGYEADGWWEWEYGLKSPLAAGTEAVVDRIVDRLTASGIG